MKFFEAVGRYLAAMRFALSGSKGFVATLLIQNIVVPLVIAVIVFASMFTAGRGGVEVAALMFVAVSLATSIASVSSLTASYAEPLTRDFIHSVYGSVKLPIAVAVTQVLIYVTIPAAIAATILRNPLIVPLSYVGYTFTSGVGLLLASILRDPMKTNSVSVLIYLALSAVAPVSLSPQAPVVAKLVPISVVNPVNAWLTPYVIAISIPLYIISVRRFEKM